MYALVFYTTTETSDVVDSNLISRAAKVDDEIFVRTHGSRYKAKVFFGPRELCETKLRMVTTDGITDTEEIETTLSVPSDEDEQSPTELREVARITSIDELLVVLEDDLKQSRAAQVVLPPSLSV